MTTFRLLHASDLHLAVRPYQYGLPDSWWDVVRFRCSPSLVSSQDPDLVKALFVFAATMPPDGIDYDILALSGDLATTGQLADLQVARAFIEGPAAVGAPPTFDLPSLGGHPGTVKLIPGNHDRFGPPPPGVNHPGNAHFDTVFGSYWGAGCGGVQELWHATKDGHTLVLIGADFTLAVNDSGNWIPFGWCGQGRAYPPLVSALVRATQEARAHYPGCIVLWMVHFLPFQAPPLLELLTAHRLLRAAQAENIPAVLCGHTHQQSGRFPHPTAPGVDFFLCGSTTQYHEPAGNYLNLLDVTFDAPGAVPHIRLHYYQYQFGQFAWAGTV